MSASAASSASSTGCCVGAAARALRALSVGRDRRAAGTRFVITLDTDTSSRAMRHGSSSAPWRIRSIAPRFDERHGPRERAATGSCSRGWPGLLGTNRSRYARMHSGEPGIDPYTRAVSDVYQDLFDEGSFIGKGIYDVDAFTRSRDGRLPENRILSHDLVEGCFARSGLLSDIQLFEDYPATYAADVSRRHRWIRGDWQIASWLLPRAPGAAGPRCPIACRDCRAGRSSTTCAAAWCPPPCSACCCWRLVRVAARVGMDRAGAPVHRLDHPRRDAAASACGGPGRGPRRTSPRPAVGAALAGPCVVRAGLPAVDAGFTVRCDRAHLLPRPGVGHGCWNGAASGEVAGQGGRGIAGSLRAMWVAPATAVLVLLGLVQGRPAALPVRGADPGPVVAGAGDRGGSAARWKPPQPKLSPSAAFLRKVARRTWRYFESHVSAARGQLAAAGQLPGTARPDASRIAPRRPTSAWRCSPTSRPMISATSAGRADRPHRETLRSMAAPGALPGALLQLVRHARPAAAAA